MKNFKLLLTTILIFLVQLNVLSQTLSGIISQNSEPVNFAEVIVFNNADMKYSTISNEQGRYTIKLESNGDYSIKIISAKRNIYEGKITVLNDTSKNVNISLSEKELQTVHIQAKKKLIERKVDRLIFNVENSVALLGGDASDALRISPGVRIQDNIIALAGKSSVKVMVDDRIVQLSGTDLINYLKSIPAETISKVEIITNPPSKYDAEGNYGLINIALKKIKTNSWNTSLRSSYQQATYATLSHGIGFSYKKEKISLLADVSYKYGKDIYTNDITYLYPSEYWMNKINNINHNKIIGNILNFNYDLGKMSSIGFQYLGNFYDNYTDENTFNKSFTNSLIKDYQTIGKSYSKPQNISINLNYNQKLDSLGKKFSIDVDYFALKSNKDNSFNSLLSDNILGTVNNINAYNYADRSVKNYFLKTDFDMPYKWANLSFGGKVSFTDTNSNILSNFYNGDTGFLNSSQTDNFNYKEDIQAIYFSAGKPLGNNWEINAGLRGEKIQTNFNSFSTGQNFKNNYFKLFPTAYVLYKLNDNNTFSLNFGRRIDRPSYSSLNPARWYLNPNSYTEGNPFLQPTYSYTYELNYNYKELLSLNLSYADIKNDSGQLTYHDTKNVTQIFKILNYTNGRNMSATLSFNYDLFPWWSTSIYLATGYSEITPFVDILSSKYSGWNGYTSSNNTFILNNSKTLVGSIYYEYIYPSISGFGRKTSSSTTYVGIKYLLLDKKLTLGINFEDIFRSDFSKYSNNSSNIQQSYKQYYDTRRFRFTLTYKFGNKNISIKKRDVGNDDEKNRAN